MNLPFAIKITNPIEQWRADTFWDKEPETIAWIDSFAGGHFVDIGANIGIYSLYCACVHPEMIIIAFEPFKASHDHLIENANINGLANIVASNVAVGSINGVVKLCHAGERAGSSGHQINNGAGVTCLSVTLNAVKTLSNMPINYIKIDTDGNEYEIIRNADLVLADESLRGVLVEVNDHKDEIVGIFERYGFTTDNRFNAMVPHSRERRQKEGIAAENIIFTRE